MNKLTHSKSSAALAAVDGSAKMEAPQEAPTTGTPIAPGELLTMLILREEDRDGAVAFLSETLAELGISGEEIAHWQKAPGICHDCAKTDDRVEARWKAKAREFPTAPIEMWRSYMKADVQNAEIRP